MIDVGKLLRLVMGLGLAGCLLAGCVPENFAPIESRWVEQTTAGGERHIQTLKQVLLENAVPVHPLNQALAFFNANRRLIKNQNWLTLIDFSQHSSQKRMYVMNLESGAVDYLVVAHGEGSDPNDTGFARRFSDIEDSGMSSVGFYLVNEPYVGKWGLSARLDGLSETNSLVRERAVVLHGADYVKEGFAQQGLTLGCPAVDLVWIQELVHRLAGKSLMYAYVEGLNVD